MITPTQNYRRLDYRAPVKLTRGLDAAVNRAIGLYHSRPGLLGQLLREAEQVDALAPEWLERSDAELHEGLMDFRAQFHRGGIHISGLVIPALAAIREAADRKLGLRPFIVQVAGALALYRGFLVEMATGEGKTLTAGLTGVLAGWSKRPCHIVTVNDYLVERDAEWMRPLYSFCGVKVGWVTGAMEPQDRLKGYDADVTYVTSKELLADFLRDRLRLSTLTDPSRRLLREMLRPPGSGSDGLVMRGLYRAIVDEADSILIDEAVTPLIISTPRHNELLAEAVVAAERIAAQLELANDYALNARYREVELSQQGRARLDSLCSNLHGLWRGVERREELVKQALTAKEFFIRDKQYIIDGGKVVIVDEFTGRQMPQRSWRQGLHQAIEAKEGLTLTDPAETIARMSFQRFFRCFYRLAGMTGTAREAGAEFWQIYRLPVITIPTNRPCIREHWPDRVFGDEASKWQGVVNEVERLHGLNRPVLVGTRSVEASERLAGMLAARGLEFRVLNAVRHKEEAAVVALAGETGCITIATNMAGRGTDIKLGRGVLGLGGLHVLATERHESGRVDRQLFGRAARQGDPGSAQAFVSGEDELLRRYLPHPVQRVVKASLASRAPGAQGLARVAFELAQRNAQAQAFKQRQAVLRGDTWLEESLAFAGSAGASP